MTSTQKTFLLAHSLKELRKIAWDTFSQWIRLRFANDNGMVSCVSCGRLKHWKEGDAGHWPSIAGRNNSILFDPRGCHFQCKQCNIFIHGNPAGYDRYMEKRYGKKIMKELVRLKQKTVKYEKEDYIKMISGWTAALKKLNR